MLQFEDSYFLIAAAIILALLLALFTYFKDSRFKEASLISKVLLVCFRFISLTIIVLFVFNPKWIYSNKKVEKPILVFLQDASNSILNYEDSLYYKKEFLDVLADNNKNLIEDFEIFNYHFKDSLFEGFTTEYNGKSTDISNALLQIENRFHNRNLAAVVLASDGVNTKGLEPSYQVNKLNVPLFTLALGDSTLKKDITLSDVNHNQLAYLNNEFPIEFEVFSNFNTDEKQHFKISNNGNIVYEEWLSLKENEALNKQIFIEAKKEGIQYYDLSISGFTGEKNTHNNKYRLAIEILNNSQNILLLASAPHPDVAALKSALEIGENYKVSSALYNEFKGEVESYNLIILHQIPNYSNRNTKLLTKLLNSNASILFIAGKATKWQTFNEVQDLLYLKTKNSSQNVFPLLNTNFAPFDLSEKAVAFINAAPPLLAPFGELSEKNFTHSLFKQKVEGIATDNDLFVFAEKEENMIAVLLAEGLWKWQLFDYQKNKSHDNFNEIIQSVSQYLTLNKDKRKLRLHYPKIGTQGDVFKLKAKVYNDNYKLVENSEVLLNLISPNGDEFRYTLNSKGSNYNVSLSNLSEGNYQFTVESTYKKETLVQQGSFAILTSTLEQQKLEANWNLLEKMSSLTNGTFLVKEEFANYSKLVKEKISSKPQIYFSKELSDLIKHKAIFFVLLLSLFFEWALRKRLGTH